MEITKPDSVNEELIAKAQTRSLDELKAKGKDSVKVIKATQISAMISEAVNRVLRDSNALSDEDIEILVQKGTKEFKKVFHQRQKERQQAEQKFRDLQDELFAARERIRELEDYVDGRAERRDGVPAPETSADLMMRMMTEMAGMKAELAQAQQQTQPGQGQGQGQGQAPAQPAAVPQAGAPAAADAPVDAVASALDQISANLNSRLEQFGKKMGISSAVEADSVNYETLFDSDDDASMESNMGDVEAKKASGGGIAGNLAKLKKLKGGG